ncbi:TetR/AcrR family transcriptional regulator [Ramlibacter sp. AW1]|uniref:TetR/AcrR family transcriptional regulator n=1 Tax=Ramlibacter aurantiacus TaxID=2801330 RepID=A0A936ZQS2_9BURK|nr:TetR/AcrR family transcriptional regulator [Ramlibacter aurantiacus]MBL0421870.1 TetR/AcrR family transcriptional regulator [Ramlibacter aurantiacus]
MKRSTHQPDTRSAVKPRSTAKGASPVRDPAPAKPRDPDKVRTSAKARAKSGAQASAPAAGKRAAAKKAPKSDLQRVDWIRAGMRILARSGVDAVLIPPLAKALGVTKGSFYWHFASRDELLLALIEEWKQHATRRVIEIVEHAGTSPQEKIRLIAFIGTNSPIDEFGGAIELAVRNWARSNPEVRRKVADVDRERVSYLATLYATVGSTVDPELLACLHYSFSTGLRLIFAYPETQKLALRQAALDQLFLPPHCR